MRRPICVAVDFVHPPVPERSWDWAAWEAGQEDEGMRIGRGPSQELAVADLFNQLEEN